MRTFSLLLLCIIFIPFQIFANNLVAKIVLYYETDAFVLSEEQKNYIENKLASLPSDKMQYFVEIDGHTDNEGNLVYNQKLSDRRANELKEFFVSNTFMAQHVFTTGHSYKQPIVENIGDNNKQLNRRVEVNIYNGNVSLKKLGNHQLQVETKVVDNQVDNEVEFASGIKFTIAANSFVTQDGEVIEGEVQLQHVPYNDYKDFILSDIPMSALNEKQDYFSSAGMFEFTASANEVELQLASGVSIGVEMPATSPEIETELFEFEESTNQWNKVQTSLAKEVIQKVKYDTIDQNLYQLKRECVGFGFEFYNVSDTTFFDNALAYLKKVPFLNPMVVDEAKRKIELHQLERVQSKWEKKQAYYNSFPEVVIDSLNDGEFKIQFATRIGKNLAASELKYFQAIKTFISKDELEKLCALDEITYVNLRSIKKENLLVLIEDRNNNAVEIALDAKPKGSKSRFKQILKKLENNFAQAKETRIQNLQLAEDKLIETKGEIMAVKASLENIAQDLSEADVYHKSMLDSIYYNLSRYNLKHQTKALFYNDEIIEVDVNRWIVANSNEQTDLSVLLETIRRGLYCSSTFNSLEFAGTYEKVIESKKRKFNNAEDKLMYSFSLNNLGVSNVDRLMHQQNVLAISPKEYVNDNNEVVMICRLFLVGTSFNGAIKYDGAYGYTPYKFLIDDNKSYGLIAIDVKGNTYKMDKSSFDKTVLQATEGARFKLNLIEETEDLSLFAAN